MSGLGLSVILRFQESWDVEKAWKGTSLSLIDGAVAVRQTS